MIAVVCCPVVTGIQQVGDLTSVTFDNAEDSLLEERDKWDEILNLRTWRIRSPDSLTTVSPVVYLLCRSHIHIWPDLHPVSTDARPVVRIARNIGRPFFPPYTVSVYLPKVMY